MAARTLSQLREEVRGLIQASTDDVTNAHIQSALSRAVRILSRKTARMVFEEQSGNGVLFEWALSTTFYIPGFSSILEVVSPFVVATQSPSEGQDPTEWTVYEKTVGAWWIVLLTTKPATGEKVRYVYTSHHALTEDVNTCTITNDLDEDRVLNYATAICFKILAAKAAQTGNSTLRTDAVSYQSRASDYLKLSEKYETASGLKPYADAEEQTGAMFIQDLDTADIGGEDWLTHPRSLR
jgi:hypothetical protein